MIVGAEVTACGACGDQEAVQDSGDISSDLSPRLGLFCPPQIPHLAGELEAH